LRRAVPGQKGNNYQYIKEAYKAFKKGNYSNASIILEKASGAGIGDAYAVFLLALSYLYNGEFARSETSLNRLEKIDSIYPPFMQLRAFLALKSSASPDEAVSSYISSLEKIPADKTLKRSLIKIEKNRDFYKLQKKAKIADFVDIPAPGRGNSRVKYGAGRGSNKKEAEGIISNRSGIIFVSLFIVIIISASVLYFYRDKVLELIDYGGSSGVNISGLEKIDMINLSGSGYGLVNKVSKEASPEFYISGDQVRNDFNRARLLIKEGEMNRAIIILNRIMNSNSSFIVKEKTEFLIRFIIESDERKYEKIKYEEIILKPWLYRGASVLISGQAVNVRDSAKGTGLSILVEFDGRNFKGAIDAFCKTPVQVKDGDTIEVMGVFYPEIGKNKRPFVSVERLMVK
jgi:tetratricopeptide (TPR) repeat protein